MILGVEERERAAREAFLKAGDEWAEHVEHVRAIGRGGPLGKVGLAIRARLLEAACAHARAKAEAEKARERAETFARVG